MRRKIGVCMLTVVLAGCWPAMVVGQADPMRHFQTIASKLDPGAEVFLVLHAGRWLEQNLARLEQGAAKDGALAESADEQELRKRAGLLRTFVSRQGMGGFQGIGLSIASRTTEQATLKLFLARDPVDAKLPFWRGLFGWQPRRLLSPDFLPDDTAIAWAATPEPATLWSLLQEGILALEDPAPLQGWQALQQRVEDVTGETAETILASLRDELLVALRFGADRGKPDFLLVVGVDDVLPRDAILSVLADLDMPVQDVALGGQTLYRVYAATDAEEQGADAVRARLAFAQVPGFLVVGSRSQLVEDALRVQRHRSGLVSRPAFRDAFRGQNMVNNGILYVSPAGAERMRDMREQQLVQQWPDAWNPVQRSLMSWLGLGGSDLPECALTLSNWRDGIMVSGMSGIGGDTLVSWLGAAPASLWFRGWMQLERWMVAQDMDKAPDAGARNVR